ncbi:nucleotidyltransferase domain-containing protein [Miltoncostaea oceani]|uniref:nucleotidyltransferase domain-containing protein n=1 Tax=Miltoncostaea oceani TaxID=2843216 RepID=UPI001C3D0D02|nr:nucleotidyltransferase [Miltoncostaea oceani]
MDWEDWLRTAAKRPSDHEDDKRDRTEREISDALAASDALSGRPYRVYAKGSYANNTNVRLNYDVDIAVEYYGYFYSDLVLDLAGHDKSEVGVVTSDDPYSRAEFKADVRAALESAFGASAVEPGRIALRIRERKTTLPADVVPSWEYRRYDGFRQNGDPIVHIGSRVYPSSGGFINNFPAQQLANGRLKTDATARRYKRMVRCLKKLQTKLVSDGVLDSELPSYLIECLVYNVPAGTFGDDSYLEDFRGVVGYIWSETRDDGGWNDWHEVHELRYLFRGAKDWSRQDAHRLADKAWDAVGLG